MSTLALAMLAISAFASFPRELPPRGGMPESECEDEHASCAEWAKAGECKSNRVFMTGQCAKTCDRCDHYQPPMPRYDEMFTAIDTNHDNGIDAKELSAQIASSSKLSRGRDSKLSDAKITVIVEQQLPPMFEKLDVNEDGQIDSEEFRREFSWLGHSLQLQWVWRLHRKAGEAVKEEASKDKAEL